jgi:cytochrome c biogenesis protein CcdA
MTLWAVVLVIVGLAMSVSAGNARMAERLGEAPTRRGRARGAVSRFMLRLGIGLLLLGVALFAISVIVHTVIMVVTIVAIGAVVVGGFTLLGRMHRPRVR